MATANPLLALFKEQLEAECAAYPGTDRLRQHGRPSLRDNLAIPLRLGRLAVVTMDTEDMLRACRKENSMGNPEAEYEKLKGLLEALSTIAARKDKMLEGSEAALKGNISNAEALSNLENNLRGARRTVLSELAGITKRFAG
jgi:hypothetical protein